MYKLENGQSLSKYCRLNKIPYTCVWTRVSLNNMSVEEAINDYLAKKGKANRYFWTYGGMTLSQYCKNNNLPYQKIINTYYRQNKYNKIKFKHCTMEEVIKMFENGEYVEGTIKHFYHGKPLYSVCKELELNYRQIINTYYSWNFRNVNKRSCTIEEVVDHFIKSKNTPK